MADDAARVPRALLQEDRLHARLELRVVERLRSYACGEQQHHERERQVDGSFHDAPNSRLSSFAGTVSRTHVKPPCSFISCAALRNDASASLLSAPPTLMRLTPAFASCEAVSAGSAALMTTLSGFVTDEATVPMVARSRRPGA